MFYFHPYLGKISNLTNIFQNGLKPPTSIPVPDDNLVSRFVAATRDQAILTNALPNPPRREQYAPNKSGDQVSSPRESSHTVDGRNPAPVDMVNIPLLAGFYTSQVVQDFFHQQYFQIFLISHPWDWSIYLHEDQYKSSKCRQINHTYKDPMGFVCGRDTYC